MRKFAKLTFVFALISLAVVACNESKEEDKIQETTVEQKEVEKVKSTMVLNANLATEADLIEIGLSSETVTQILGKRPFLSMNDLDVLVGGPNKEELYKKMFIPFNLNTTAKSDFKIIPGVGERMAHEFEEYRPYNSIQQFRREIGKYVDKDEVARYENYVFVPVELNTATEEDIKALPGVGKRIAHEFEEYRPYTSLEQFRKEIGKYVDDQELTRLERLVYLKE